jgi:hypothetical protein
VETFEGDIIVVKCPDDDFPIRVEMVEWQNMKYTLDEETKEIRETVIGTFTQYPLKLACLNAARAGFKISKYLDAKAKSAIDIPAVNSHSAKSVDDTSGVVQQPALFRQLKEWRNTKTKEMGLPHYMILPQNTMVTLANFMPQSMPALNLVKGMGKKKSEKFGEELLEIIISYCKIENLAPNVEMLIGEKIPKKIKEETKKISYDLFNEGKTISQIAEERELSIKTIEGHLAYYVGTGEIPIDKFLSQEITDLIAGHFEGSDDFTMGPVKAALGDKVSWSDIRFVINHLKFLKNLKMKSESKPSADNV